MNAKEAVAARILALCDERGIAINAGNQVKKKRRFHSDPGAPDFFYVCGKLLDIDFGENERESIEV